MGNYLEIYNEAVERKHRGTLKLSTEDSNCSARRQRSPHRASVLGAVIPEATGRELLPDHHRQAVDEALADSHDVT